MTEAPGHNPIRWDCRNGCFNELMRPKIEIFAECFPRNIGMMDIDGTVELNGHFLFLEFKTAGDLNAGQHYYFTRLTRLPGVEAWVVCCNSAIMDVHAVKLVINGISRPWEGCDLGDLKRRLREWARRVDRKAA